MSLRISRREALSWALASAALGCRSESRKAPSVAVSAAPSALAWGGLDVAHVSQMRDDERGGSVVVLLHGFGARGDDLVSLAQALQVPRARFILPAAPLALAGGGRAWWNIDAADRPRYATDPQANAPSAPSAALDAARLAVQGVLRSALDRYVPDSLMLAGFSQGAMLSLDVALAAAPSVQRVAMLSGALLVDAATRLDAFNGARPAVFISHGHGDRRLPFAGGERARQALEMRGFSVKFRDFEGGHEIPEAIVAELKSFLFPA